MVEEGIRIHPPIPVGEEDARIHFNERLSISLEGPLFFSKVAKLADRARQDSQLSVVRHREVQVQRIA